MKRGTFEYDGFVEVEKKLMQMSLTDPKLSAKIRELVREVLEAQRENVISAIRSELKTDPHNSVRSVRYAVYKRIFGGSIHILQGMRRSARGGTRMSDYEGHQRGFILRWIDQGAGSASEPRQIGGRKGSVLRERRNNPILRNGAYYGNRGYIVGRHFFKSIGTRSIQQAAADLAQLIENEITNQLSS